MKYLTGIVIMLALSVSCRSDHEDSGKPVVGVSILPQQFFIERIAGELVEVAVMIPPGASPATYEPTAGQLSALSHSELYMRIGYVEFELSWMDKIKSINPDMRVVDLSRGIETFSESSDEAGPHAGHIHHGPDPHIWMSLVNASIIATNVCDDLAHQYPEHADQFNQNLQQLLKEIDALHGAVSERLAPYQSMGFMIYHPALTYFARDYHLIQHPLEIEGKTPSPAHMKRMTDLGREEEIKAIFIQRQFDQQNAEVLAGEIGAEIIQIDPLDPEWLIQMGYIADQLKMTFHGASAD
jgi:zinc transport system substrate-binding protein